MKPSAVAGNVAGKMGGPGFALQTRARAACVVLSAIMAVGAPPACLAQGPPDRPAARAQRDGRPGPQHGPPRRGMHGQGWRGEHAPDWEGIGEPDRQEIREFMEQHFPALSLELQELREKDPELFRRRIRRVVHPLTRLMRVMRTDPELGALAIRERQIDLEIRRLVMDVHNADRKPSDERVRRALTDLHTQLFDVQQKRRQLEIVRIEARLMELQGRLEENAKTRDDYIRQRVDAILKDPGKWLLPPEQEDAPLPPEEIPPPESKEEK